MKALCTKYEEKYVVMASVLEVMTIELSKQYTNQLPLLESGVTQKDLVALVQNHPLIKNFGWLSTKSINEIIEEMKDLSLIHDNIFLLNAPLFLSDEGREAYKKQTFHIIASNLMEAREARRLSKLAIAVAVISVVIAIVSIVM